MPVLRAANSAEELGLLRAVTTDLADADALGVYCDWLEDRDDPRGPFLRKFLAAFAKKGRLPVIPEEFSPAWAEVLGLPIRRRLRQGLEARERGMKKYLRGEYPNGFAAYEPHFDAIFRTLRPGVRLVAGDAAPLESFPVGTTRVGGLPDLPVGMAWPHHPPSSKLRGEEAIVQFLLQIDLAEARWTFADGALPESGLLSLFRSFSYFDDDAPPLVYHFPAGTALERTAPTVIPTGFDDHAAMAVACPLTLADSLQSRGDLPHPGEGEPNPDYLVEGYFDQRARNHWFCTHWTKGLDHGWVAEGLEARNLTGHLKLFELLYDDALDWAFGDGGRLHVYVPPDAARAGRFDAVVNYEV